VQLGSTRAASRGPGVLAFAAASHTNSGETGADLVAVGNSRDSALVGATPLLSTSRRMHPASKGALVAPESRGLAANATRLVSPRLLKSSLRLDPMRFTSRTVWFFLVTGLLAGCANDDSESVPEDRVVTLAMKPFAVPPGVDSYKCQNFANPFGEDVDISAFESSMTLGSHHLLLFFKPFATDTDVDDCSGLEFTEPSPYATQLQNDSIVYPEGTALALNKNQGFRIQVHYLNPDPKLFLSVNVTLGLHIAKPGAARQRAGQLFVVEDQIHVDPYSEATVTHTCTPPSGLSFLTAFGHMHSHGRTFDAKIGDDAIYHSETWDNPTPAVFSPPFTAAGDGKLTFSCTYQNNTAQALTFGESAKTDEMCVFVAQVFPVNESSDVACQ
jgi:hypothetical protein